MTGTEPPAACLRSPVADRPSAPPPRRRDALRNRDLLIEAARETFAEKGLQAPLDLIARRAGVGNATLYRHFPNRKALVDEVFSSTLTEVVLAGDRALAIRNAWTGLTDYLYAVITALPTERCAGHPTASCPDATSLELIHVRHRRTVGFLLREGQKQGTIRPDITPEDLLFSLAVLGRSLPALTTTVPGAFRRPLALILDGLRIHPTAPSLPAPSLTADELDEVLLSPTRPCPREEPAGPGQDSR
ncbi:TetR/AcrR family transcriptional regulator [Streptomyces sp. NBC_00247]|uniref:TetR/AcrR family transcriptional regulator n=1 Tax=Streptomyces sp. NBC_00247 TaxID=2975689 RepID=UPI002E2AF80D|nr:helix-turn-helix domain-containing protein [Streptomyces sp. NBC_00247]